MPNKLNTLGKLNRYALAMQMTPAQALLLLIDAYQGSEKASELKKLFLSGANISTNHEKIMAYFQDPLLKQHQINFDFEQISADPSRRYFESLLAYYTLIDAIDHIELRAVQEHYKAVVNYYTTKLSGAFLTYMLEAFRIGKSFQTRDVTMTEYLDAIERLNTQNYAALNKKNKIKLSLILKAALISVIGTRNINDKLPINIYNHGFFAYRQRIAKTENNYLPSSKMGLMKSYNPLIPVHDKNKLHAATSFNYTRPADYYAIDHTATDNNAAGQMASFCELIAKQLVHPFSSAISGTMLIQLRLFKALHSLGKLQFADDEKFLAYIRVFTSLLLFNSGGHSFIEFLFPLSIDSIQDNFGFINNFNELNMEYILYNNNEHAFEKALRKTLLFNEQIFLKKLLHADFYQVVKCKEVYTEQLTQVVTTFGAYDNRRKNIDIETFTKKVHEQIKHIKCAPKPDYITVKKSVEEELKKIQVLEDKYYQGIFFSTWRKPNSQLQRKLTYAKEKLSEFQISPIQAPKVG